MATVGPTNIPAFFNADSDFRTWGSTISAALSTLGLVATSDTGQINWTTVSKPSATSTSQGYEIWRFADSLQGTSPVYLKLEYGSSGATDRPSLWITVGSGSNGSGTLTGQVGTRTQVGPSASKTAGTNLPFYASGNSGELILVVNLDTAATTFGMLIAVERPKDNTDTTTSDGAVLTCYSAAATVAHAFIPATGSIPSALGNGNWPAVSPNVWSRSSSGANVDVVPIFVPVGGAWRFSHINVHKSADMTAGGTYTATIFGGSHTYLSLDQACSSTASPVMGVNPGLSVRFE